MGMEKAEGGIVADCAEIAEMISHPLELGHHGPQPDGARRNLESERRFDGPGEGNPIADRAVPRYVTCQSGRLAETCTRHERLDALVHVAEPLLEANDGLPIRSEPEMARLDDSGMDGAHGDSVEALALRGQEGIGRRTRRMVFARSEWLADVPATVVEPRPRVLGAVGFEAVEIVNGPLETDRRFVNQADGREPALRAGLPTRDVRESFIIFRSVSYLGLEKHSESQLNCNCAFHRPPLCGRKHSAENGFLWPLRGSDSQCRNPGLTS